jgi:hypothetical protein
VKFIKYDIADVNLNIAMSGKQRTFFSSEHDWFAARVRQHIDNTEHKQVAVSKVFQTAFCLSTK